VSFRGTVNHHPTCKNTTISTRETIPLSQPDYGNRLHPL
jgi:hypothetical protein